MPTIREMIDVPEQVMGMSNATGLTIKAGGPGSGRRPYGSAWHKSMGAVLKNHGFKDDGGSKGGYDNKGNWHSGRSETSYVKNNGNKIHWVNLNHIDGTWTHSVLTNKGRADGRGNKMNTSARNRSSSALDLDRHLSSYSK